MSYKLSNKIYHFPGMAFGHKQSTCIVGVEFSHQTLISVNPRRVALLLNNSEILKNVKLYAEAQMQAVDLLSHFYIAMQRALDIPVFKANCEYVISYKMTEDQRYLFQLALPYQLPQFSLAILQWVMDALFSESLSNRELKSRLIALQDELRRFGIKGTNSINLLEAANEKGINASQLVGRIYSLGHGSSSFWLDSTHTEKTSLLGNSVAKDKYNCAVILRAYGLPAPIHELAINENQACQIANKIGFPVVVKPANQDQGRGVAAGLSSELDVFQAYKAARKISGRILVEKHIKGCDFRITVLHGKVIKVMQRFAGGLVGDGNSSIAELLEISHASKQSQIAYNREGKYRLVLDEEAISLLKEQGLTEESVIALGEFIPLRRKNNISTGGSQKLIPYDNVHPDNILLACRASEVLGLDISGVDLIIPDIGKSWLSEGGVICEVNGQPQIGKTDTPEIFYEMLDSLMPEQGVIPLYLQITFGLSPDDRFEAASSFAKTHACNGFTVLNQVFFNHTKETQPSKNGYEAAKRLLIDRRISAGVISMEAEEILLYGLPTFRWSNINIICAHPIDRENLLFKKILYLLRRYNFTVDVITY